MCNNECVSDGTCKHNEECYADVCFSSEQMKVVDKLLANERRKFAEWLQRTSSYIQYDYEDERPTHYYLTVDEILAEYERKQK